jgi:formylglycine-generating enzyme required for sulfatase activity
MYPYGKTAKGPNLGRTCKVGSYAANAWGLYDMHGNVNQWCSDYYGPYGELENTDPLRVNKGTENYRVLRGGSWGDRARFCRAAMRHWNTPSTRHGSVGFRVAVRLD